MKNQKKAVARCCLAVLCLFAVRMNSAADDSLYETGKEISVLQWNTLKYPVTDPGGKEKLSAVLEGFENAVQIDQEEASELLEQCSDSGSPSFFGTADFDSDAVSLIYEDGTRDLFWFFQNEDDDWYMKTADGNVYGNVDAATEFLPEKGASNSDNHPVKLFPPSEDFLLLEQQFETLDLRYYLTSEVLKLMEKGTELETAIDSAKKLVTARAKIYRYALENGCELTGDEFVSAAEYLLHPSPETISNYEEAEAVYEKAGTTLQQSMEKHRDAEKVLLTINKLWYTALMDFRVGNDHENGLTYLRSEEYWNALCYEIVPASITDEELVDFFAELEEAEAFCRERIA